MNKIEELEELVQQAIVLEDQESILVFKGLWNRFQSSQEFSQIPDGARFNRQVVEVSNRFRALEDGFAKSDWSDLSKINLTGSLVTLKRMLIDREQEIRTNRHPDR